MTQRERQVLQLIESNPMLSQKEMAKALGITRECVGSHITNLKKKGYILGSGYILRTDSYAVVVGGVNVDIGGKSFAPLIPADSNPGTVHVSLGGVGRNIAHNLRLMGIDVRMLTAYGDDVNGQRVAASCSELDIDLSHARRITGGITSTYLYLTDEKGEMVLAVSDMEICKKITPTYLSNNLSLLQNAQLIIADTNIPVESLIYLAENCTAPIFCDPISTAKAEKLKPILNKIHTLKPNRLEAEQLSGIKIETMADVEKAADKLLEQGVHRLFISLGADGIYAAMGDERMQLQNLPGQMVNTTGCGDAAMAANAWAYLEGMDLKETALAALAAGSIAMEHNETINPAMSATALRARMGR